MSVMTSTAEARWRAACLAGLAAFAALALTALLAGIAPGDVTVRQGLIDGQTSRMLEVARWVNSGGTGWVLVPTMLLLFALSPVARRHWWLWGAVFAVSGLAETAAKFLVGRPRPAGESFGFPSGHSTAVAMFAVIFITHDLRRISPPTGITDQLAGAGYGEGLWSQQVLGLRRMAQALSPRRRRPA
ncbi:MAG: hypothetical protein AAB328_06365, partial [candidate division NC10 bacterium]